MQIIPVYNFDQPVSAAMRIPPFVDGIAKELTGNPRATRAALNLFRRPQVASAQYSATGVTTYNFFTQGFGDNNKERNSLPVGGKFQNHIVIHGIACTFMIHDQMLNSFDGNDATTLVSDIVNGIFQAGVFKFLANGDRKLCVPRPFVHMPMRAGQVQVKSAGIKTLTLTDGTPNTYPGTVVTPVPQATLGVNDAAAYVLDPMWFIPQNAPFQITIEYPSGALNPIASSVINDTSNPLYIQVRLDTTEISIRQ